jgi:hypothetical protein
LSLQGGYSIGSSGAAGNIALGPSGWYGIIVKDQSGGIATGPVFAVQDVLGSTNYLRVRPTGVDTVGYLSAKRLDLSIGAGLATNSFTGSRMGNSAGSYTGYTGTDAYGRFTVVVGVTGYTYNPQITMFYKDGPKVMPHVISKLRMPISPTFVLPWLVDSETATSVTFTLMSGNPTGGGCPTGLGFYTIEYMSLG